MKKKFFLIDVAFPPSSSPSPFFFRFPLPPSAHYYSSYFLLTNITTNQRSSLWRSNLTFQGNCFPPKGQMKNHLTFGGNGFLGEKNNLTFQGNGFSLIWPSEEMNIHGFDLPRKLILIARKTFDLLRKWSDLLRKWIFKNMEYKETAFFVISVIEKIDFLLARFPISKKWLPINQSTD